MPVTDDENKEIVLTLRAASETTNIKLESLEDAYMGFISAGKPDDDFMDWLGTLLVDLGVSEKTFHETREKIATGAP